MVLADLRNIIKAGGTHKRRERRVCVNVGATTSIGVCEEEILMELYKDSATQGVKENFLLVVANFKKVYNSYEKRV